MNLQAHESPALTVDGVEKTYTGGGQEVRAVRSVSFDVPPGGFFTLLGPSGCGKTTTMRCVAGLERPDAGTITMSGETVSDPRTFVTTDKRPIGMVFQSYAIWPHMTVFENVAFPLRAARPKVPRAEMTSRVNEVLELVDLGGMTKRQATQMSGGQQQRLALARALVRRPKVLLLDEPLSNLDAKLRERLRGEIRSLQKQLGITTLYVTHDQAEALSMSDTIAVMDSGVIAQLATPREIYARPRTRFVAEFVGTINLLAGTIKGLGDRRLIVGTELGERPLIVDDQQRDGTLAAQEVRVAIRPEAISLHHGAAPDRENVFVGVVELAMFLGERLDAQVTVGGQRLSVHASATIDLAPGDSVWVEIPPAACTLLVDGGSPPADELDASPAHVPPGVPTA